MTTEPIARLWRHPDGRERITRPGSIIDADASWRVVGKLLLAPAWEPLTPERLAALHGEPIHTRYWLALVGRSSPLEAHTLRFGRDTCFAHGPRVIYAHEVSHIMPFHTPSMPT